MPKLSIIIPTFNSASTIHECLQSIAGQTFTDYQILIQDGESRDHTFDVIRSFQLENPNIDIDLRQEPDKGTYDAMNKAVQRSTGEWLYFLGSDDALHDPTVLSRIITNPAASENVLYGNVQVIGGGQAGLAHDGAIYDGPFHLKKLLSRNICHQAVFYRSSFVREVGAYNLDYSVCADWDFNLRCFSRTPFTYLDVIVAKFNASGLSGQGRRDLRFIADVAKNVIEYFGLSLDDPLINSPGFIGFQEVVNMRRSKPEKALRALAKRISLRK